MKNVKTYIQAGAWVALVLLLVPSLWYSLRTPFALIDDNGVWRLVHQMPGIIPWFQEAWFHPDYRFRITFDIYEWVTWTLFGDNSVLHHGMRWVLKAIVVWSTFKILDLMAPVKKSTVNLSFWAFCVVYVFFPNNPEARLAPQELLTVTFLALLLYEIGRLCVPFRGNLEALSLKRYLWMIFVFTAMLWSKETNVVMGIVTLAILACLNLRRWMYLLPFAVIVLITGFRVWAEKEAGGYGISPVTWHLIQHNINWYCKSLFLKKASLLCPLLLVVPFLTGVAGLVVQTWKTRRLQMEPFLIFCWLVCLNMLAFYLITLTSWDMVLRYFYPLVYLLALGIALTLLAFEAFLSRRRWALIGVVMAASVYFIGINYYNFVYQFACQYYTRIAEQDALKSADRLLREGHIVALTEDSEHEIDMKIHFNEYLPYYKHTNYRVTVLPSQVPLDGCYYISREKKVLPAGHQVYRHFDDEGVSRILWWSYRVSSWFKFNRPTSSYVDAGAEGIGNYGEETPPWYIYDCRDIMSPSNYAQNHFPIRR